MYALTIDVFVMLLILVRPADRAQRPAHRALVPGRARRDRRAPRRPAGQRRRASWKKPRTRPTPATKPPTRPRTTTPRTRTQLRDTADDDKDAYDELVDEDADLSRQDRARGHRGARGRAHPLLRVSRRSRARSRVRRSARSCSSIRVVRMDGSPLGWKGAIVRYGLILLGANLLLILLPVFGILGLLAARWLVLPGARLDAQPEPPGDAGPRGEDARRRRLDLTVRFAIRRVREDRDGRSRLPEVRVRLRRGRSKEQKYLLGGKGANLAEMTNLGLPVPPGFTISTDACKAYMAARRPAAGRPHGRGRGRARGARAEDGQAPRRRRRPAARVGAFRCAVLDARDDGHRPQPRAQRRLGEGPRQADEQRAVRVRLVPPVRADVRQDRARRARRRVRGGAARPRRGEGVLGRDRAVARPTSPASSRRSRRS